MALDIELTRHRFTLDEYHRMAETGILNEDDRVELIRGEIVQMTPMGRRHASCVARLNDVLLGALRGHTVLWPQLPLTILPDSEPQPDVILLRYRDDFYRDALPGPEDVALLIEVADSSLRYDRRLKTPLYAEAGVREYWIIDLEGDAVEVYRSPLGARFQSVERIGLDATVSPLAFPDVHIAVTSFLS
jgi:Uma2 family endonuclease